MRSESPAICSGRCRNAFRCLESTIASASASHVCDEGHTDVRLGGLLYHRSSNGQSPACISHLGSSREDDSHLDTNFNDNDTLELIHDHIPTGDLHEHVKYWDLGRAFGFIRPDDKYSHALNHRDVFVHTKDTNGQYQSRWWQSSNYLSTGARVRFELRVKSNGKLQAKDVEVVPDGVGH